MDVRMCVSLQCNNVCPRKFAETVLARCLIGIDLRRRRERATIAWILGVVLDDRFDPGIFVDNLRVLRVGGR